MDLMAEAARLALDDASAPASSIDSIQVVNVLSWTYPDPAGALGEKVGASPRDLAYTSVGGNTPQWLVNRASEMISRGEAEVVLIAGAESFASAKAARAMGRKLDRGVRTAQPALIGDDRQGLGPLEMKAGLIAPSQVYPLIENAYRAHTGRSIVDHQRALGELCASLNAVAAENPLSWLPEKHSADEIATPDPTNRMIGFPYTKYMNSILNVDQGAALLIASVEAADRIGTPREKWVFPQSGAECNDQWCVSQRSDMWRSHAIEAAGRATLESAGLDMGDVALVDLYSCFPSAVELGADALGLPLDGSIPLTVTGGLMYFGGPGNNYATHSIGRMVELLRESPGEYGLCTALGWYVTKHAIGLYSTEPPAGGFKRPDLSEAQARIDAMESPFTEDLADGDLVSIATYTVLYDREGKPMSAPAIVDGEGGRAIVHLPIDDAVEFVRADHIGKRAKVFDTSGQTPKAALEE